MYMERSLIMLEFPEVLTLSSQLSKEVCGKTVQEVLPPVKRHKFCWYEGDPADYGSRLNGARVLSSYGFGIYAALGFDNGCELCWNDGVNVRLADSSALPGTYQLAITFSDGSALVFTVAMYGGIILHSGNYENEYYLKSLNSISPLSPEFPTYFQKTFSKSKPGLSVKAFLATEQRFPGIGNGVLQDILFQSGLHPKRKLSTLSEQEQTKLCRNITAVLTEMTECGGRDTEKDLYGKAGGYRTKMSKLSYSAPCPVCGGTIKKEAYLGGSVYYCPHCQPFVM